MTKLQKSKQKWICKLKNIKLKAYLFICLFVSKDKVTKIKTNKVFKIYLDMSWILVTGLKYCKYISENKL